MDSIANDIIKTTEPEKEAPKKNFNPLIIIVVFVIVVIIYLMYRKYSSSAKEAKDIKLKNKEFIDKLNQIMLEP